MYLNRVEFKLHRAPDLQEFNLTSLIYSFKMTGRLCSHFCTLLNSSSVAAQGSSLALSVKNFVLSQIYPSRNVFRTPLFHIGVIWRLQLMSNWVLCVLYVVKHTTCIWNLLYFVYFCVFALIFEQFCDRISNDLCLSGVFSFIFRYGVLLFV